MVTKSNCVLTPWGISVEKGKKILIEKGEWQRSGINADVSEIMIRDIPVVDGISIDGEKIGKLSLINCGDYNYLKLHGLEIGKFEISGS
ncbi:MAG: hypothetical protein DRP64_15085, partial [Verrucomicrobia bacterium]